MRLTNIERKKIGVVGVDSGQLMIMDPCYVGSEWKSRENAKILAIRFWGEGKEETAEYLKSKGYNVEKNHMPYRIEVLNEDIYLKIAEEISSYSKEIGKKVVFAPPNG